jgi:cytochrome c553
MRNFAALAVLLLAGSLRAAEPGPDFGARVGPLLKAHCVKCHGAEKQSGKVRLDDLSNEVGKDLDRWLAIRDQLRDGLMPPAKEPRLDDAEARAMVAWITAQTSTQAARLPNQGNLVPHELLFGKPAEPGAAPPGRAWRLSPDGYMNFTRDLTRGKAAPGVVQPFTLIPERGIKDFAALYTIDEPSTEILVRNAEAIVEIQTGHEVKDGKVSGKDGSVAEFVALMGPDAEPTRKQLESAVQTQFRLAIGRAAEAAEVDRFLGLYDKCARANDRPGAVKTMLQAVLLRTDAMFRSELGRNQADSAGPRLLSPHELALAFSLTLSNRREPGIMVLQDMAESDLTTREQIAVQLRRILDDSKIEKPRFMKFFREYFEYGKAIEVFKDKPEDAFKDDPERFKHEPAVLVADTDRLIAHILAEDKDILRRLLTTPDSFVNFALRENKKTGKIEPVRAMVPSPPSKKDKNQRPIHGPEYIYGFEIADWPAVQPAPLPKDTRIGVLMQPSWLIAFSTNFDNDPVRRGRWVRERLLGGTVPDLPIGVVAQVPNDPHRTFRDRLTVTRAAQCWKCHQRMDELGLPFENFDHYGRFRTSETVLDPEATAKNLDPKGKPLGPVTRQVELNTTGRIDASGDPKLDGDVKDPREMLRKLADSDRVRQVFVRHVFRFFLGRNETLSDALTLQQADQAYVESGGSFKALVLSLMTSDAFLYRSNALASQPSSSRGPK